MTTYLLSHESSPVASIKRTEALASVEISWVFFAYLFSRFSSKQPQQEQNKVNFDSSHSRASFKIVPRLENFSGYGPGII